LLGSITVSSPLWAGEPIAKIRQTTDRIIAVVSDHKLEGPENAVKRKCLIREAVDERFDWEGMSRRTLAVHWAPRSEEEKKEFIELFGKLLERTYLDRVESYSGEEVEYEGERIEDDYALVSVRIKTKQQTEIPVLYRLRRKEGDWLVYDVIIEGVSLINNYRNQFNSIIIRSSFEQLIEQLRAKVSEN
jgi:phospholipid transport system substrate-binding protein